MASPGSPAQDAETELQPRSGVLEEVVVVQAVTIEDLPGTGELARALADQDLRTETLLTLIAVAGLLEEGTSLSRDSQVLAARFREDRQWLDRVATRHPRLIPRGSHLDPAAWHVMLELDRLQIAPERLVDPLGPDNGILLRQLFDRSNEPLAIAILPEAMQRAELQSGALWADLLASIMVNDGLLQAVLDLHEEWFVQWNGLESPGGDDPERLADGAPEAEPPAAGDTGDGEDAQLAARAWMDRVLENAVGRLRLLADSTLQPGPADQRLLMQLRIDLVSAMPRMADPYLTDAAYVLVLASAIDGLNDGRYLAFTESLLWVVADMLMKAPSANPAPMIEASAPIETAEAAESASAEAVDTAEAVFASPLPRLLAELLPQLSNAYASDFSRIDPRINATLAAVFDAAQFLQGDQADSERLAALRGGIGDAITQMVLLLPDMNYYFDQPVRRQISEEVAACTGPMTGLDASAAAGLTREQFDQCLSNLVDMSVNLVNREELAGDPDGPFGRNQLRRELRMASSQRINYALGYLHEHSPTACEMPAELIPNPLEWSSLATWVTWFARQSPVYFQTPENEALIAQIREQGQRILDDMAQQVDCFSGEGSGVNDLVVRSLQDYRNSLQELVLGIREAELQYRDSRLKPGADIVLHGDADQPTAYRSEDMVIAPCDPARICEMNGELEATRALIGLFPTPYLIADQAGMGQVEICYDNVRWEERRGEPVRADDPHVANYFGKLSFDVIGRYVENGESTPVFGANFVSPDEYHYLFAAAVPEVAEDSCPVEWVGSRIVTNLNSDSMIRVVPDRLTYLAGARKKPSEVINANWGKGAEWRDWFVTGLGVTPYEFEGDAALSDRLNQHLQGLYQAQQAAVYSSLLRPQARGGRFDDDMLLELQQELTAKKALVRSYVNLFYPDQMLASDEIRSGLEGYDSLLDSRALLRFREAKVAVASINDRGLARLGAFQADWNRQLESVRRSGSISVSIAHALMRLNALYQDFFTQPASPGQPQIQPPAAVAEPREEATPGGG